jgi:site-specific DNA recombinase
MRTDGATLTAIAGELNDQGIKTRREGNWHASSVREILNNESKYRGGFRGESSERWPVILES